LLAASFGNAQPACRPVEFQSAASASLKPSASTHITLLRQTDGSYTAFELTDASPYRIVRATPDFQKQFTTCPGPPVSGILPFLQPPEVFTRLASGGYLWVRRSDLNSAPGSYFGLIVVVFDSALNLISEAQYPLLIVEALAVVDVNGDGIPDILSGTAHPHSTTLDVLIGNGGSSFQPPVSYPIASSLNIESMAVADLNGDGKRDVTIVTGGVGEFGGKISVFLGNGDGTFQQERLVASAIDAHAVAVADLNGDGKPDLAYTTGSAAGGIAPMVMVAPGLGDGTFATPAQFAVADSYSVAIGDVDGDGIPDIVTSGITVLFGDGKGAFARRRDYWEDTAGSIILTDFDGDGKTDIVIAFGDAQALTGPAIALFFNRGGGLFSGAPVSVIPNLAQANNGIYDIAAANFNAANFSHDGIPDLAVLELFRLDILTGKGDGTFAPGFTYRPTDSVPDAFLVADFNNDGKSDIVVATDAGPLAPASAIRLDVFLGKGDGTFAQPVSIPSPHGAQALVAGDFNHDGKQDVALLISTYQSGASDEVLIYLGDGKGSFAAPVSYKVGPASSAIAVGDFNGDGALDLVIADFGAPPNLSFLFGKGDGTFSMATVVPFAGNAGPYALAVADFNRDGKLDLAVTALNAMTPMIQVWLGHGDGTFQPPVPLPATAYSGISAADLNGDSFPDLLVWGGGTSGFLLGNGDGTFQAPVALTNTGPLAVTDLNRDGKPDVAAAASLTGVAAFLNISGPPAPLTVVSAASLLPGPLAAESLATAFGTGLASTTVEADLPNLPTALDGTTITITDASGAARTAPLLYVSPTQVNFVVPAGTSIGNAKVTLTNSGGLSRSSVVQIAPVAPSLFTVNTSGLAAGYITRVSAGNVQTFEPIFTVQNGSIVPVPVDLGPSTDQVYLVLLGTGIRHAGTAGISASIQGQPAPVTYAGLQSEVPGLDQVNVLLPRELADSGVVNVVLAAPSANANTVHLSIK
jgi:uncharacterized protein (TIGR03437 family)